jgi:hypothetical protein
MTEVYKQRMTAEQMLLLESTMLDGKDSEFRRKVIEKSVSMAKKGGQVSSASKADGMP